MLIKQSLLIFYGGSTYLVHGWQCTGCNLHRKNGGEAATRITRKQRQQLFHRRRELFFVPLKGLTGLNTKNATIIESAGTHFLRCFELFWYSVKSVLNIFSGFPYQY